MADIAGMAAASATRFGDVLRRHRLAIGLTQEELAERAGLSRRGIADLERGVRQHPRKDTVALLADALGLTGPDRTAFAAAARGMLVLPRPPATADDAADLPATTPDAAPAPSAFGARLRRLRLAAGLTQAALAARAGLSERAVNDLERDPSRTPRLETVTLLAEALGLAPDDRTQLLAAARPATAPDAGAAPATALDRHLHNLPIQLTSFIGRERELAELKPLLLANRLLTLTGPGGTGKTRLALSLAADVLEQFAGGVWLVELASLADSALVPQKVAAALGLRDEPGRPLLEVVREYLRAKSALLLLDNCEHLIATCAEVAEALLRAAPGVRILASSREALGIAGETAYRVPSLALPEPGQVHDLTALARNDCVRLFLERAASMSPPLLLTARNAPAIAQIGRRLDGIPLALELAAARTRVLPPEQIAARLDDRFRLLKGGSRTALPRHQTLLALFEWSHDLLSEAERVLLRRLSVFAGGWSLEAAQAVCGEGLGEDVLETLEHLADKSLIDVATPIDAAEGRYRLLETIRQYARDKLLASGEAEQVRDRHLEHFAQLAEAAEPHLRRAEQMAWVERLEREHDNLRAALTRALETGKRQSALRLAGALSYFWDLRGHSEGRRWLDDALELDTRQQGEGATARSASEPALPTGAEMARRAKVLYGAARLHVWALMDFAGSLARIEEGLHLWRELKDKWWTAVALEHVGFLWLGLDLKKATACLEEGVALAREVEDRWPLALCLIRLAQAVSYADVAAARRMCEEGVAIARHVGDRSVLSLGLEELSPLYWEQGDLIAAESVAAEALLEGRAVGSVAEVLVANIWLVCVACYQGDLAKAREHCAQYLAYCRETGASQWIIFGFAAFAMVACFSGEPERGVRLFAAADGILRMTGFDANSPGAGAPSGRIVGQALAQARAQLGESAFAAAWAAGLALTVEQALALAMEDAGAEVPPSHG
ncbi:MAG TPA: helix-turn-helix domain-containing protein [Ktedonobacterales bacterium]|nr:helix-turn-helix domain-containing protein [Ktedonobacterales bacterium]